MIIFYSPHTWKSSMRATCTVCLKVSTIEQHENHHLTLPWVFWTLGRECHYTSYTSLIPRLPQRTLVGITLPVQPLFLHWPSSSSYLHYLYTDSETHFKVVVVSETFEGMPLLKVCREQNHGLVFRLSPFSVLITCSMQKLQVIKKPDYN